MEANFVKQFIEKTGCDSETAYTFLEKWNWDLYASLEQWNKIIKHDTVVNEVKKLSRGISEASDNEVLVYRARDALANDFDNKRFSKFDNNYLNIPETNFFLPDFDEYEVDFQEFLVKDLIDKNVMKALEDSGKLNWWCNTIGYKNRLWPLLTSGDGNCLLHAASLSMFGFHDRLLTLRQALHNFVISSNPITESIKRRWRWHESKLNLDIGVQHSEQEWESEWLDVVNSASTNKLSGEANGCYQGLEAIHILCLAHVLRRVIIVIANTIAKDSHDEPLTPIYFDGIYIPFAFDERSCWKSPLLLIYNNSHFSSLVFMEHKSHESTQSQFCIPITHYEGDYLPIRFLVDPGADFNWKNFVKAHVHQEESKRISQLNVISSYLEIFDFYNSPLHKESESKTDQGEGDMTNNNIPKQLQNLGKQFLFLTKLAIPKKEKVCDNTKMPLFCVKICIKKHAFQNEIIQNYIKFARQRFEYSQISQYPHHTTNKITQDTKEEFVSCINKCGGYATENTSYLCPICYKQQKKQLQLLEDNTLCFATGKSRFYREPDMASYSATKNLPKSILKSNNTLYLSNSTFFNDSNKPFNHRNNNLEQANVDVFAEDLYTEVDCENISNEEQPKNLVSEFCFGLVPASDSLEPGGTGERWDRGVSNENSDKANISITHIG